MLTTGNMMSIRGEARNGYNVMNANLYVKERFVPKTPKTFHNVSVQRQHTCAGCGQIHLAMRMFSPKSMLSSASPTRCIWRIVRTLRLCLSRSALTRVQAMTAIRASANGTATWEWCRKHGAHSIMPPPTCA